jgi:hypothetical protein
MVKTTALVMTKSGGAALAPLSEFVELDNDLAALAAAKDCVSERELDRRRRSLVPRWAAADTPATADNMATELGLLIAAYPTARADLEKFVGILALEVQACRPKPTR